MRTCMADHHRIHESGPVRIRTAGLNHDIEMQLSVVLNIDIMTSRSAKNPVSFCRLKTLGVLSVK
jgi:hypothetical protein